MYFLNLPYQLADTEHTCILIRKCSKTKQNLSMQNFIEIQLYAVIVQADIINSPCAVPISFST